MILGKDTQKEGYLTYIGMASFLSLFPVTLHIYTHSLLRMAISFCFRCSFSRTEALSSLLVSGQFFFCQNQKGEPMQETTQTATKDHRRPEAPDRQAENRQNHL